MNMEALVTGERGTKGEGTERKESDEDRMQLWLPGRGN